MRYLNQECMVSMNSNDTNQNISYYLDMHQLCMMYLQVIRYQNMIKDLMDQKDSQLMGT